MRSPPGLIPSENMTCFGSPDLLWLPMKYKWTGISKQEGIHRNHLLKELESNLVCILVIQNDVITTGVYILPRGTPGGKFWHSLGRILKKFR